MENYKNAKYNIAKNQIEGDFLVLNKDDESIDINLENIKSKVIYFSMKENLKRSLLWHRKRLHNKYNKWKRRRDNKS